MAKFIFQIIIIKIFITSFIFSQNFSVNLHLEKRDYLYREAITILTELVNNDSEEYVMIKPIFEDGILNLIVKNEIGEILPLYETKIFSLNTRIRLKKDESVYIFFNVEPLANMGGFPICPCRSNKLLQPGSYTFQVEF